MLAGTREMQQQGQDDFVLPFAGRGWQGFEQEAAKRKEKGEKPLIFHVRCKNAQLQRWLGRETSLRISVRISC